MPALIPTPPGGAKRAQRGFTLIELMVAMAISLMVMAGIVAIFSSSRHSYETTDRLSRIQESGRIALDAMSRDVRASGFVGCARAPTYLSTSLNNASNLAWNFLDGPVRGYQFVSAGTWTPTIDASIASPADGSDVLVVRVPKPDATPLRLQADMAGGSDALTVPNTTTSGLAVGDVALAYSCEAQSYFVVTSFAGGVISHAAGAAVPSNAVDTINYAYRRNAEVLPVQTVVYYVRRSAAAASGIGPADARSLWRKVGNAAAEEMVEGVEQMQLQFGVDINGDEVVDQYVAANAVANWANVYSVSVALLQRSLDGYGTDHDNQTYQLLDVTAPAAGDRRLREVFSTTASIRNRVPVN